jgi:ABC-2 type transport system ATP-binding protein
MLAIETNRLTKRFRRLKGYRDLLLYRWSKPDIVALDDVNLSVHPGELFGILGQNGAGKTTLIRILCTTLLPSSGTARVAGHDVLRSPGEVRRRIGLVQTEERSFYWRLTGRQNLEFFAALFHVPAATARKRVSRLLDELDLVDEAEQPFQSLSTGTRHKFAIIRGLMTEPSILFLDEPTRSLDPISAQAIRTFIRRRVVDDLGTTVILATHSLPEAEALCTRMALVRDGSVVAEGTPAQLRASLGRGMRCVAKAHQVPAGLGDRLSHAESVRSVNIVPNETHVRLDIELADELGALDDVLRTILEAGVSVFEVNTEAPTLEEVYVEVLGSERDRPPAETG